MHALRVTIITALWIILIFLTVSWAMNGKVKSAIAGLVGILAPLIYFLFQVDHG